MAAKAKSSVRTIDEYLAALSADKRAALEKLRKTIQSAAPKAEECISYQLAAFRLDGKPLVALGATGGHCAFYLMSNTTVAAHEAELAKYDTSKGTIRFQADKPLPAALVRKLVKARIAENAGQRSKAKGPRAAATAKSVAMPQRTRTAKQQPASSQTDPAVVEFLDKLDHALKPVIEAVRQLILGVSPEIREGIKWNAPSFRTTDWFATLNLRAKDGEERVWLILHTGAKAKASAAKGLKIADPAGLLTWLAKDRCLVTIGDGKDLKAKREALQAIVREWIGQM